MVCSNLTEAMKKKEMAKLYSKCYSLLNTLYGTTIKGKTNNKRSCLSISFILKTDFTQLKTSYTDEGDCQWKQLKWNKFPFYGKKLSEKIINGD